MRRSRVAGGRLRLATFVIAVTLGVLPAAAAFAGTPTSTVTVPGSTRAAAVQAVLDRILGPGNSMVTVSDTIRTSSGSATSVQWGAGVTASSAATVATVPGGTTKSVSQQNVVGRTRTTTVTPPGTLLRQSVAVTVDSAHVGGTGTTGLRRLVAAAAGLDPTRGDTMSLVVARFARPVVVKASTPSIVVTSTPAAVPAIWILGGLIAVVLLALMFGRRPRASNAVVRS